MLYSSVTNVAANESIFTPEIIVGQRVGVKLRTGSVHDSPTPRKKSRKKLSNQLSPHWEIGDDRTLSVFSEWRSVFHQFQVRGRSRPLKLSIYYRIISGDLIFVPSWTRRAIGELSFKLSSAHMGYLRAKNIWASRSFWQSQTSQLLGYLRECTMKILVFCLPVLSMFVGVLVTDFWMLYYIDKDWSWAGQQWSSSWDAQTREM